MDSDGIKTLLAARHTNDVFVPECKDGPSQTGTHLRLDAWAMRRSWTHLEFMGYEIKTSRSDFLQDTKWPQYLPLCNRLTFVCPPGVIRPEELDDKIGLLWVSKAGNSLVTKKKAVFREITPPARLLIYILMCRAEIRGSEQGEYNASDKDAERRRRVHYYEQTVRDRQIDRSIGYYLSKRSAERLQHLQSQLDTQRQESEQLKTVKTMLQRLDLLPEEVGWRELNHAQWELKKKLGLQELLSDLRTVERTCRNTIETIEKETQDGGLQSAVEDSGGMEAGEQPAEPARPGVSAGEQPGGGDDRGGDPV